MRIFSGIRASGDKTLGNYSGGYRQYAATQEQGDAVFCIVDLHSITTAYEPDGLHDPIEQLPHRTFALRRAERTTKILGSDHICGQL